MRHCAGGRDAVAPGGQHIAGGAEPRQVGAARHCQGGLGAVGAPRRKISQRAPARRLHAARRFGSQQRLELDAVDDHRFRQLRRNDRRGDFQDRFLREKQAALRHRPRLAGKAKVPQPVQEVGGEGAGAAQVGDGGIVKAQGGQAVQGIVHAGRHQVAPVGGVFPHIQAESSLAVHTLGEVGLRHRQLVKIGEQARIAGRHGQLRGFVGVEHSQSIVAPAGRRRGDAP